MLRCLMRLRTESMSSSRLIVLPSRRLATVCTYGRMREFTSLRSSSTKPSRFKVSGSNLAGDASPAGDSSTAVASTAVASTAVGFSVVASSVVVCTVVAFGESALGASTLSWWDCPRGVGGAVQLGADWLAFRRAAMLRFFLFALPGAVWLYFRLRALVHWRRWCSRQPKGQRRSRRRAQRG